MADLTRKQIKDILPDDVKISIRKIEFSMLGDYAYELAISRNGETIPSGIFTPEQLDKWADVLRALKDIKGQTYKGKHILT